MRLPGQPDAEQGHVPTALGQATGSRKYFTIGEIPAEERLQALLPWPVTCSISDYAGHRLTFQLFAQSPPFSHLLAVYNNYDFSGPRSTWSPGTFGVADAVRK